VSLPHSTPQPDATFSASRDTSTRRWHSGDVKQALLISALLFPILACNETPGIPKGFEAGAAAPTPVIPAVATYTPPAPIVDAAPPEWVTAQHVLVAYKGAKNAPDTVTRTKAEAKARIDEVLTKAKAGADFADLARDYSDDVDAKERFGSAGKFKRSERVKPFSDAAFALPINGVSDVVETVYGFHVIRRNQ